MSTQDLLDPRTSMGRVTLLVENLDRMTAYYELGVGLEVLEQGSAHTVLGRGGVASLRLEHAPHLKHAPRSSAGLFHTAVLFATRAELAAAVYSVATRFPQSFTGSSDHLVSNAFYFDDPEGNGVELYWDLPRDEWHWNGSQVEMGTLALDPNAFLRTHLSADGADAASGDDRALRAIRGGQAQVGHVHLKVGDITTAEAFYVDALGFERMTRFGDQASFIAAGGYHHHIGMNTWQSRGAGDRTPALGLGQVSILVPTTEDVLAVDERMRAHGVQTRHDGDTLRFDDPWRNLVTVAVQGVDPADSPKPQPIPVG